MAVLPIVGVNRNTLEIPDIALRQKSVNVDIKDPKVMNWVRHLVEDMFETMYSTPWGGVGLAAPQVGVLWRLAVIDSDRYADKPKSEKREPFVMINPEIIEVSEEKETDREACLSLSYWAGKVDRAHRIRVKFYDHLGNPVELAGEGYLARVIQHEVDHLNGKLYADRIGDFSKLVSSTLPAIREKDALIVRLYKEAKTDAS